MTAVDIGKKVDKKYRMNMGLPSIITGLWTSPVKELPSQYLGQHKNTRPYETTHSHPSCPLLSLPDKQHIPIVKHGIHPLIGRCHALVVKRVERVPACLKTAHVYRSKSRPAQHTDTLRLSLAPFSTCWRTPAGNCTNRPLTSRNR